VCQPLAMTPRRLLWLCLLITPWATWAASPPAPTPLAANHEFNFIVLGDSQFDHPFVFNRIVNQVARLQPAFVVQVGDLISGYTSATIATSQWQRFRAQIAPLHNTTFVPVAGNHDLYGRNKKANQALADLYQQQWGPDYHHFRYRNSLFIILNSDAVNAERQIAGKQLRWLTQTLSSATDAHIFVFLHRPPGRLKNAKQLHQLFAKSQVDYVFYGHQHHLHFRKQDGVTYIMTNAAATAGVNNPQAGSFPHFLQVSVRDDSAAVSVVKSDSVLAPSQFDPADNNDLFALTRRFAPAQVNLAATKKGYRITIPINNSSNRQIQVFGHCTSADNRWQFTPQQLPILSLAPKARAKLKLSAAQLPANSAHNTLSTPQCELTVPFQTSSGEWLQHRVRVTTKHQS